MLKVPQQQYIRYLREFEGVSIAEIAQTIGVNWRTAKKYADQEDWNLKPRRSRHKAPVMDPYKDLVDTFLMEDSLLPRKQRRCGQRIYEILYHEHGYRGCLKNVTEYIRRRRQEMDLEKATAYQRLEHPEGEAQVDFTTIQVSKDSALHDYKLLIMSFPFSNAAFIHPVPSENQECFLEGLKKLLSKAGGVPERIWFDNLSAAVVSIEPDGKRQLTDAFLRFSAHYRFEAVFCNPNSGNEKGHVENKCGYSKRNWCAPIPLFESQEKLAEQLDVQADKDMDRPHYLKGVHIRELWKQEQRKLRVLPSVEYEVFHLKPASVNRYGEIRVDQSNIPVLNAKPESIVMLKVWWDRIDVLDEFHRLLTTVPRPYMGRQMEIPWQEAFRGFIRKPRSVTHAQLVKMLPDSLQRYITPEDLRLRKERLQAVFHWCGNYTVSEIGGVLGKLDNDPPVELITARLTLLRPVSRNDNGHWEEPYTPVEIRKMAMDLTRYDFLAKGGEGK